MPFSRDAFLDVFLAYNEALWPAALGLWMLSAAVFGAFVLGIRRASRLVPALLAVLWVWAALAYHAAYFTRINPLAWLFAAVFLLQAAILSATRFRVAGPEEPALLRRRILSSLLIAYALAYPLIVWADGFSYPRMPTFGVPCPTAILTIGFLLARPACSPRAAAIPVLWALIGGSAAWLFGMRADLVLAAAGTVLAIDVVHGALARMNVHRKERAT
jgi:hypothetical protein